MPKKTKDKTQKDLHVQSKASLFKLLQKEISELQRLQLDLKLGKLKDVHKPKKKRQQIAQILTIIREKEL